MTIRHFLPRSATSALCLSLALSLPAGADEVLEITIYPGGIHGDVSPLSNLPSAPQRPGTLTVPGVTETQRELSRIPGAVSVVPTTRYDDSYAHNIEDVMDFTPGVFARKRYGAEVRLSVRGSGLSRGFHMRGLELLQDGVPFNLADGSADFQEIDPLIAQHIEVYKGGNGVRFGSSTLGGAINFVMPTAYTAQAANLFRMEGGSYGTARVHAQAARVYGTTDVFAAMSANHADGYRDHEREESIRFSTNIGHRFNDRAETRFYLTSNVVDQDMPGSLTLGQALNTPEMANPGSVSGDHQRNVRSLRVANKTAMKLEDGGLIELGGYAGYKRLFHPIFQVIDQRGPVAGFFVRYRGESTLAGLRNVFTLGGDVSWSEVEAKRYTNAGGSRSLPMTSNATQTASNQRLYAENQLYIADTVALVGGVTGVASQRKLDDRLNPANSDDTSFNSLNPKVGLLWDAAENTQFYANVSRSYEPPTFTELVQGAGQYVPLDPQRAVTFEAGTRGASASIAWDVALYHARVKGELVNFTVGAGIPASTFNADETIHQGIEASLTLDLGAYGLQSALPEGSRLLLEQAYTYSDFHFEGDATYGDNKLAGMPAHIYVAALRYKSPASNGLGWDIAPKIEWVPDGGYVDYANTLEAPGYATIGIEGGVDLKRGVRLFLDARNLTDKKYISTYSTVTDARVVPTDVFYPGEGRSVFAGLKIAF